MEVVLVIALTFHIYRMFIVDKKSCRCLPRVLKDSKIADMDYFRIGYFLLALPPLVVSKCAFPDAFS